MLERRISRYAGPRDRCPQAPCGQKRRGRDDLEATMLERDKQETGIGNQIFQNKPTKSNTIYRSLRQWPPRFPFAGDNISVTFRFPFESTYLLNGTAPHISCAGLREQVTETEFFKRLSGSRVNQYRKIA